MTQLSSEDFAKEATRIAESGKKVNIVLRAMGACAIRIHCPKSQFILDNLKRAISDLDFMSYGRFEEKLNNLFKDLGYQSESEMSKFYTHMYGQVRSRYLEPKSRRNVDIFFDKLEMCHTIDFKNRLEIDFPTISLSDLLLEKMQIVKINEKDILDTLVLILEHDVAEGDKETINSRYISEVLAEDWGFYYTVTTNLKRIRHLLPEYNVFTGDPRATVEQRVDKLLDAIEKQPKSLKWKMRARIGTSRKWYVDVDEVSMGPRV
jgi:hypothetical protein